MNLKMNHNDLYFLHYIIIAVLSISSCKAREIEYGHTSALVTKDQMLKAREILIRIQDILPTEYSADGCYARAMLMAAELVRNDIPSSAVFVRGRFLRERFMWSFHVAPFFILADGSAKPKGIEDVIVMDPLYDKDLKGLGLYDWALKNNPVEIDGNNFPSVEEIRNGLEKMKASKPERLGYSFVNGEEIISYQQKIPTAPERTGFNKDFFSRMVDSVEKMREFTDGELGYSCAQAARNFYLLGNKSKVRELKIEFTRLIADLSEKKKYQKIFLDNDLRSICYTNEHSVLSLKNGWYSGLEYRERLEISAKDLACTYNEEASVTTCKYLDGVIIPLTKNEFFYEDGNGRGDVYEVEE